MVDLAGLTEKQRRFCDEYLIDLNATQAAIRAGYSPKTAATIAAENLTKPKVAENIKKRMDEKEDALIAKQDEVLKYLTAVMRREMKEFVVVTCMEEKTEVIPGEGGSKPTRRRKNRRSSRFRRGCATRTRRQSCWASATGCSRTGWMCRAACR